MHKMKIARFLYLLHNRGMTIEQIQKEYGVSKKYIENKIQYYIKNTEKG